MKTEEIFGTNIADFLAPVVNLEVLKTGNETVNALVTNGRVHIEGYDPITLTMGNDYLTFQELEEMNLHQSYTGSEITYQNLSDITNLNFEVLEMSQNETSIYWFTSCDGAKYTMYNISGAVEECEISQPDLPQFDAVSDNGTNQTNQTSVTSEEDT